MPLCGEKPCCHVLGIARAAIKIRRTWGEDCPDKARWPDSFNRAFRMEEKRQRAMPHGGCSALV